jgi:hypothetical protein
VDRRTVGLLAATTGWFEVAVLDLDVHAWLVEYDYESNMEAILRELALVADAYLRGECRIEQKRRLLPLRPVLQIPVNGNEWTLGRRTSKRHYPEDSTH